MKNLELLAPAGNLTKLNTAFYFGADAAYIGGKSFSLRSFSDNFSRDDFTKAVTLAHLNGKKIYVTANIFAKNSDFEELKDYFVFLNEISVDGVIVSDPGVFSILRKTAPKLSPHISTQANTLNKYSAKFWADEGATRIILARELSLNDIKEIRDYLPQDIEIEAFCHGAMCISYSGRCLLSDYFASRPSNRGECVQACRWDYSLREKHSDGNYYDISEDDKGTYILNSKDLNMIEHLDEMANAGVTSFKIEGRMKSEYYLATVVNAYRRAFDSLLKNGQAYKNDNLFNNELLKTNHRAFTTAYMLDKNANTVNYNDSQSVGEKTFSALVLDYDKTTKRAIIEMRNRFKEGDLLEVLSPSEQLNKVVEIKNLTKLSGESVKDAKIVQQKLSFDCQLPLVKGDILRK